MSKWEMVSRQAKDMLERFYISDSLYVLQEKLDEDAWMDMISHMLNCSSFCVKMPLGNCNIIVHLANQNSVFSMDIANKLF